MNKELDNLRQLRFLAISTELTTQAEVDELIEPIETELKETDKLRRINCELLEQKDALREERDKYKEAVDMLKGNISLEFIQYPGDKYEVWLNRGYEEPVLIANTKEKYELLSEVFKR